MKKRILSGVMAITMLAMSGCCISHDWKEATCTEPQTCAECGKTKGEALGHTWEEATCAAPKTCTVCGETEGEALEHTWAEATCSAPKTCTVCGATEGKALEHTLTEANYQQAATCEVCGETVGEPLQADFEKYGIVCNAKLDTPIDYVATCNNDWTKSTVAEATFSDFEIFKSDETHEAVDGYEWQAVTLTLKYSDDNAKRYGMSYYRGATTYYDLEGYINYNGIAGEHFTFDNVKLRKDYTLSEDYKYCVCETRFYYRVPEGYDGIVITLQDREAEEKYNAGEKEWWNDNTVFFRLKK